MKPNRLEAAILVLVAVVVVTLSIVDPRWPARVMDDMQADRPWATMRGDGGPR